ncbi:MAG: glycosyltransferase [Gammaproteobacteria bacterium]|nr:glycosyltransferase [Gammaproteobacteria bacterium]MDH3467682.1 glycosyltransferase [Gammaproteobacteria bacterium]
MCKSLPMSIVVPTYRREQVLIDSLQQLVKLPTPASELIVVDQTLNHERAVADALSDWASQGLIRWIRQNKVSVTRAMNCALICAKYDIVLFVDDDIDIHTDLAKEHFDAHSRYHATVVVGQIVQPWQQAIPKGAYIANNDPDAFAFNSSDGAWITRAMGGNMSMQRQDAIDIGGFDEHFVGAAYRFEAEFTERIIRAGGTIRFAPGAALHHLKHPSGGTRSFGDAGSAYLPYHSVGEYYYLLRATGISGRMLRLISRTARAGMTRQHLTRPWLLPGTLLGEVVGLLWACVLRLRAPKYVETTPDHV